MERSPGDLCGNPPLENGLDPATNLIDRASSSSRTNRPVKLRRKAADDRRRAHRARMKDARRWGGAAYQQSPQRDRELADLRTWEALRACDDLPPREQCMGATTLLGLRNAGRIAPYPPALRSRDLRAAIASDVIATPRCYAPACEVPHRVDCGCCTRKAQAFRRRCLELVAYLLAISAGPVLGRPHEWLIARHLDVGKLLGCCPSLAADVARHLHAHGYLRRRPDYDTDHVRLPGGTTYVRHVRAPSAYAIAPKVVLILGIPAIGGKKYQASETQPQSGLPAELPGDRQQGAPGGGVPTASGRSIVHVPDEAASAPQQAVKARSEAHHVPDVGPVPSGQERVKPRADALPGGTDERDTALEPTSGATARKLAVRDRRRTEELAMVAHNAERAARRRWEAREVTLTSIADAKLRALQAREAELEARHERAAAVLAAAELGAIDGVTIADALATPGVGAAAAAAKAERDQIRRLRWQGRPTGRPEISDEDLVPELAADELAELRRSVSPTECEGATVTTGDDDDLEVILARLQRHVYVTEIGHALATLGRALAIAGAVAAAPARLAELGLLEQLGTRDVDQVATDALEAAGIPGAATAGVLTRIRWSARRMYAGELSGAIATLGRSLAGAGEVAAARDGLGLILHEADLAFLLRRDSLLFAPQREVEQLVVELEQLGIPRAATLAVLRWMSSGGAS